jgi:uncharacterized protein (TIRG00374 family)
MADILERMMMAQNWIPHLVKDKFHKLLVAFKRFRGLGVADYVAIGVNIIVRHLVGICSIYFLAMAVHMPLSIIDIAWIRSVAILISALPIAFSGIGVREGALVFFMQQFGVMPAVAVSFSLLFLLKTLVSAMAGGCLEFYDHFIGNDKKS